MSRLDGRDYIYLIWKDYKTRQRYIVGQLSKNSHYEFEYFKNEVKKAIQNGFEPLIAFPDIEYVYKNDEIFPAFSSRLPDKRRKDIKEVLDKYNLKKYDEFELLKKSGARLPIDTLEFIDPIFLEESNIVRECYLAGTRHHNFCNNDCSNSLNLREGDLLTLERDSSNNYDPNAVKVLRSSGECIGYIPMFYSKEVLTALETNRDVKCVVKSIAKENNCQECIKIELRIN